MADAASARRDATTDEESAAAVSPPSARAAADQKKLRRNARDRSRSQLKKTTMEAMRREVAALETTKRQLEQQFPSLSIREGEETIPWTHEPTEAAGDGVRAQHLRVLQQIERLRSENRAMALDVLQRDLFRSAAQNLLDARAKDLAPVDASDEPRPQLAGSTAIAPIPTRDAAEMARRIARQIASARCECDGRMQRFSGARVFGWSDFRLRTDASVQFTIQKALLNQCANLLAARSWDAFADPTQLRHLLPGGVECELRIVQRVGDDAIVFDRVTTSRGFDGLQYTALRTVYMLVRARDDRGNWYVGMKTIDLPVFRTALAPHESWCDIFYWFHFEDGATVVDDSRGCAGTGTAVVFGGALSYYNESIARAWLAELVFLAVRWESKVIAPVLLKN